MEPVVKTRQGKTRGQVINGVISFKGLPYAAPPFGPNRLKGPQPPKPWRGVRDAFSFGPKSPQPAYPPQIASLLPPESTTSGEDCLNLNVWSSDLGSARHPVMVWIPGGEYAYHGTGASPWYDGDGFARHGIVCVTINYRVGPDGFLYLGEHDANRGLLDQIAALEWVQENIAGFGGDPDNVTVFGESAGAMSVAMLLAMPLAKGLFRRAIIQSGGAQHVISIATARLLADRFASNLGAKATSEGIAAVPVDRVLQAQTEIEAQLANHPDPEKWGTEVALSMMPWQPVVDGKTILEPPLDLLRAGASSGVDLLIGTNTDEHRLFLVPLGMIDQIGAETLTRIVAAYGLPVESTLTAYRELHPDANTGDLFAAIQTDWCWRIPAIRVADAHATETAGTFMYEFAWRSPQYDGQLGACHALEIPFVFDTLGVGTETLWGTDPPQQLADAMHAAWVAFARCGDPGWLRYGVDRRMTMRFGTDSGIVADPFALERALWKGFR